jgi:DNA-binding SARP family transcriptional activator
MEIRVLGPLEVVDGDRVVPVPRHKQRALLAVLALHAGEPHSVDSLVDDLWGEHAPVNARAALQNYVSQLRVVLGAERIVRRPAGYVLDVASDDVDLGRFRRLAEQARAATDIAARVSAARAALALWRGPPLPELVYEPFAGPALPPLEDERLSLYEDLVDAELSLGRHTQVLDEIEALLGVHPYDERLWQQLMVALYRSGRQADALEAFTKARRLFAELGLDPGPELRRRQRLILEQSSELDLPDLPASVLEPVRKTVTVLFAGLPEPSGEIDAEALHARHAEFTACVKTAVQYHGGTVERLGGDTVMGIFGLPAAHEDDALRALRAAAMAARTQAAGARYGVATGGVYAERSTGGELTVTGAAVIAARRLEQAARPGAILLSPPTHALVRDAVKVERSSRGAAVFRLLEIIEGAAPVRRRFDAPLIDRVPELAELHRAFTEATGAQGCCVMTVVGEAGIGKTRLARQLCDELADEARILVGRCVSYGKGATHLLLAEMLAEAGDDLDTALAGTTSTGEELIALRRYFESLARDRPLVLIFEDIHWAEPTLLDVIDYLGSRVDAAPILALCLSRPDLLEHRRDWRVGVRLQALDDDDTHAFIRALGGSPEPGIDERIVGIAEGNPLYAEQLLAFAAERGTLDSVPPTLEGLLHSRLDRLAPEERHVLQRAAIVGREFTRDAVANLCTPEVVTTLDERLAAVAEAGLAVRAGARFRFHHVLIRDAAYTSVPKAERAGLHERVADWLDGGPDELVGHHLEQAARYLLELDAGDGRAVQLAGAAGTRLGAAGLRAWKRGDAPAAVNLLGRAARLLPERDPLRLELMCELGVASRGAGDLKSAEDVLVAASESARAAGERRFELRGRLELANVRLFSDPGGRADDLLRVAHEAIEVFEAVGDDHGLARAWRLIGFVEGAMHCQYARSAEAVERALARERTTGWSTAAILGDLAAALFYGPTPVPRAIRRCNALLEGADLGGEANVLPFLAGLEAMHERFAAARTLLDRAERLYAELGQGTFGLAACSARRAGVELLAGDVVAAREAMQRHHAVLEQMGDRAGLATSAATLAAVSLLGGRPDEADSWSHVAEELASSEDVPTQFLSGAVRAKLLALEGDAAAAEALARHAVALSETTDSLSQRAEVLLDLADVLRLCGGPAPAAEAASRALDLYEQKKDRAGARRARALVAELAPV